MIFKCKTCEFLSREFERLAKANDELLKANLELSRQIAITSNPQGQLWASGFYNQPEPASPPKDQFCDDFGNIVTFE